MTTEHWIDEPISRASEDRLGRVVLARQIARLLEETHSYDSSVVHGLVGHWGSGKSSVLALVESELALAKSEWLVVKFSPWAASDWGGLLIEFYGAIVEALPGKWKIRKFKKGLGNLLEASAPIANIAGSLVGVGGAGGLVDRIAFWIRKEKSWDARFQEASRRLVSLEKKILVVADDVDRLHGEDLLNLLKLVRLVGRFPSVSYILAYDERALQSSLVSGVAANEASDARMFIEKIVQYPIYIPPLIESQIFDLLNRSLDSVFEESRHQLSGDGNRLSFADVWTTLLRTPRAIHRYVAQVRLELAFHQPGEVDLADIVMLTLIRTQAPELFEDVSRGLQTLTRSRDKNSPFEWEAWLVRQPEHTRPAFQELIERLFPATSSGSGDSALPPRVAHPDYFYRYFLRGIPAQDVADSIVRAAILEAEDGDYASLERLFSETQSGKKVEIAAGKLMRLSNWNEGDGLAPIGAIRTILSNLHKLPKRSRSLLPSTHQLMLRWVAETLTRIPPATSIEQVRDALAAIRNVMDRISVLELVAHEADPSLPLAVRRVAEEEASRLLRLLVKNVTQGDHAEQLGEIEHWTLLVRTFIPTEGRDTLDAEIRAGLSPDDLAARFVVISHWRGSGDSTSIEIGGFLWDSFDQLMPVGLRFSEPTNKEFDRKDVSWPSRREFALREIARRSSV